MKIKVGISNRHVHLTKEVSNILFGNDFNLEIKRPLKQLGEFASTSVISIKGPNGIIENVRVIGPLRKYTQVEILRKDRNILGIDPPIRNSGELENSASLILIGPVGSVKLDNVCIIAKMHIHMSANDLLIFNKKNKDLVNVRTNENIIIENVEIRSNDTCTLEFQLDREEALIYNIENDDEVEIC